MPRSVLIDWNQPLIPAVARKLLASADSGTVDLSRILLILPTVQSGRRLREALALAMAEGGSGLFPPEIVTPDQLLANAIKNAPIASDEHMLAAWVSVLEEIKLSHFAAVFPIEPTRSIGWQLGMAQRLMQLRTELGAEGMDISTSANAAADAGHEAERWRQLARLEGLYLDTLKVHDLIDPIQARREAAQVYQAPPSIERIILVATPDPQPLPLKALATAEATTPIELWLYGEDPDHFDAWGRPLTAIWTQRPLQLEDWNCHLKTVADPKSAAQEITQHLSRAEPESVLLGLANTTLNPFLAKALADKGISTYDPEGHKLNLTKSGRLAEMLGQLAEDSSIATIRSLLQHPDLFNWLNSSETQNSLLTHLDHLFEKHLTPDLESLLNFSGRQDRDQPLHTALKAIQKLERQLKHTTTYSKALAQVLQQIYQEQETTSPPEDSIPWKDQASTLRKLLKRTAESETSFPKLSSEVARNTIQQNLKRTNVYPDRPLEAHDLLGWLELLWNDAPHLILTGLNEGIVPESIIGDAFLPESLRAALGLRTNADRFARDAYLIEALCRRRATNGRIDILVPQTESDGSPLKPSRLLFLGEAETLLPRTRQLFHPPTNHTANISHNLPWKLSPPTGLEMPTSLSVSTLKSYLECPFRFFLKHILKMRPLDLETRELSPAAFGNLFHDTVETLNSRKLHAATKPKELLEELNQTADQLIRNRYGKKNSFALRLQREALLARISAFVDRQIEDIQKNGSIEILNTEDAFKVKIDGFTIKGRIDRIDQREQYIELIDYKTSDSSKRPAQAHLAIIAQKAPPAHLPEAALFKHEGRTYRWTDLQLPLYVLAQQKNGAERPRVAYFNLAKTLDKSGIERWEDFNQSHLDSAQSCASAVIEKIKAGIFWPPNPNIRSNYDDFAPLFPDGIENSVHADAFKNYPFTTKDT